MADVPHERSLEKNLEGKPFVLLGVNSYRDRDLLKNVLAKEKIPWRSWWDGGGTSGPISRRWNIQAWPTLYLIDAKGVIRYKGEQLRAITLRKKGDGWVPVQLLDEAVGTLVKEMDHR